MQIPVNKAGVSPGQFFMPIQTAQLSAFPKKQMVIREVVTPPFSLNQIGPLSILRFGNMPLPDNVHLKRAYILGDLHFNNHTHANTGSMKRHSRVVEKWDQILADYEVESKKGPFQFQLILNGDIFDLLESWPHHAVTDAFDKNRELTVTKQVIDDILAHNPDIEDRLKQFLSKDNVTLHYVIGNHERWLTEPLAQNHLKQRLGLSPSSPKLTFSRKFYDPHLQLLAVHGDQFDPYCAPAAKGMNLSEKLDLLVLKRLVARLPQLLEKEGYTPDIIEQVQTVVRSVEYVRPIHHAFTYLYQNLADLNGKTQPKGAKPLLSLLLEETVVGLKEAYPGNLLGKVLGLGVSRKLVVKLLTTGAGTKLLNQLIANMVRKVRDDKTQLKNAVALLEEEGRDKPIRILVLGHTHKILDQTVSYMVNGRKQYCRVMNPGSYKKTILFPNPDLVYPAGLLKVQREKNHPDEIEVDFTLSQRRMVQTG